MDDVDERIVSLLREDGRRSYASLGRVVGLSTAAVKRRVERLESDGVIQGYVAMVNRGKLGLELQAFIDLKFAGTARMEDIWKAADGVAPVMAAYAVAGDLDAVLHVRVRDIGHLQEVLAHLRAKPDVTGTRTRIILEARDHDAS
ncbi:Lrp/AsnC family transcriptional regulator [Solirubrobacter phytolaccae]|uniref:Lrp/AsnC family transcriptional regulator n=1 Tax=Solirubrobacter phytolaccae TaxID=1404360 RepID=A0A9X3NBJ4_9ACTN|nr:Lrp/AsnC family transcriptional regulator [Solirubrobacter phytolaccae]MDA0182911.1 Lrp/AsnC family transcriptional regulator [Solirubrobacter phytolaccae]